MQNMKQFRKLRETPLRAIEPEGWLRRYLELQRDGLTGHLEVSGYPFDTIGWGGPRLKEGEDYWGPYEQCGYWADAMIRCGHLLGDSFLLEKARKQTDFVLKHADADGYLGPKFLKKGGFPGAEGDPFVLGTRWAHVPLFRALMAEHSALGKSSIPAALAKHYLSGTSAHSFYREVANIEPICWAYEQTGDKRLLRHALEAFEQYNEICAHQDTSLKNLLSGKRATEHGVTFLEQGKLGAILYMHTGNRRFLRATVNAFRKLDRDSMLVDGVPSSSEHLRGKDPLDSHETCDIADYSWAAGYLLMATGEVEYADKIERACFNAAPGAVRSDFKALQYFSCPNQVIADASSNHNEFFRGRKWMTYRPQPSGIQCCPAEVNRTMPNFAARMWMQDAAGNPTAVLYGPCRLQVEVGSRRQPVTIVEETNYPFSERIDFQIRTDEPVQFAMQLRIPHWCAKAQVLVNGRPLKGKPKAGTFVKIARTFAHNNRITLVLPMELKLTRQRRGGVSVERGPLVFALRVEEDWRIDPSDPHQTKDFPAWNVYAKSPWNYAMAFDERKLSEQIEVVQAAMTAEPWSISAAPIQLRVPAQKVRGWKVERHKVILSYYRSRKRKHPMHGNFAFTPQLPDPATLPVRLARKVETVTLVPYGCAKMRIAIFPRAK